MNSFFLDIKNKFTNLFSHFKDKIDENNSWFNLNNDNLDISESIEEYTNSLNSTENNLFLNQTENTNNKEFNSTLNNIVKYVINSIRNPNPNYNLLTSVSTNSLINFNNTLKGILVNTIDNISKNLSEEDQQKLDIMLSSTLKNVIKDVKKEFETNNENKKIIDLNIEENKLKIENIEKIIESESDFTCSSDDISDDNFEDIDIYDSENNDNKIVLWNDERNNHNKKILEKELLENCVEMFNNLGLDNDIDNNDVSLKNILEIIKKLD